MSSKRHMIEVEGLGKRYWVGGHQLIDSMGMHALLDRMMRAPIHFVADKFFDKKPASHYPVGKGHMRWAIRDVSFKVAEREVLGIVGHNGAGKSVLLKLLSRITSPTEGYARLHGRVSSMLEAGTSFHGELTGRENIRLAGAILGMKRSVIDARMDEIISFSEVEEYIDTPVKRYSTGMVMRLGFSVSAHLDTDIMLIDEVLAVLQRISERAILIRNGRVEMDGAPDRVVAEHVATTKSAQTAEPHADYRGRPSRRPAR